MESYQPPHHYMRPPPPPPPPASMGGDPHLGLHPPPPGSWYPGQFHYHPSHSPSPPPSAQPPPNHNQWAPPPPYHAHPNAPYPAPHQQPYPPPPPFPPDPPLNQDWGNANWAHPPSREYPGHTHEEDWAARARAWASARSAMESQHPQSQFTPTARQDEPSHYSNQYSQPVEPHFQNIQHTSVPTSGFQNYQTPIAPLTRPPLAHQQEPGSMGSYAPDGHFTAKDGTPGGDVRAAFPHHHGSSSSSVHQQEVPSSYSSVPGNEEMSEGRQHGHSLAADGRSVPIEQVQFPYSNHSLHPMDQPLDFAPRFSHENDPKMRLGYPDSSGAARGTDTAGVGSSLHPWTAPGAPDVSYPPIASAFPSAPQHDPSMGVPQFPAQPPAPIFERGVSFQPAVPPVASAVGLAVGATLHPPAAFPVDAYGSSLSSERPKKAAVPNWLREEIIKNKATITSSVSEPLKEESQSVEDESLDKSTRKGDIAESKSMDSSKSAEDEDDDDEDYEEAQRIAAINQEIKRVLTEVLLKVTDELFDEIATKVLNEDDVTDDDPNSSVSNQKLSPPPPPVPAPKASAKVIVSVKTKESVLENATVESSSGSAGAGNVLGLANYASDDDDDDDDENLTSNVPKSQKDVSHPHGAGENGHPVPELEDKNHSRSLVSGGGDHVNRSSVSADHGKDANNSIIQQDDHDSKSLMKSDAAKSVDTIGRTTINDADISVERHSSRKSEYDSVERDARRHHKHEHKRDSSERDMNHMNKGGESSKEREVDKVASLGRRDERHQKKEKAEDHNIVKERSKEQRGKDKEKKRDSDSRKRSPHHDSKDSKKERERDKKTSGKDDADRKKERAKDEKDDRSRHKSSRHKRRRSSSVGRRSKQSRESPVISDGSTSEASDDSRRKAISKRRNSSPSPVRSRQRQVSRSPHSKHSQRRHSPYSSLDGGRERRSRSRSRSPVRRHR